MMTLWKKYPDNAIDRLDAARTPEPPKGKPPEGEPTKDTAKKPQRITWNVPQSIVVGTPLGTLPQAVVVEGNLGAAPDFG